VHLIQITIGFVSWISPGLFPAFDGFVRAIRATSGRVGFVRAVLGAFVRLQWLRSRGFQVVAAAELASFAPSSGG
jgi:hypothetical protein